MDRRLRLATPALRWLMFVVRGQWRTLNVWRTPLMTYLTRGQRFTANGKELREQVIVPRAGRFNLNILSALMLFRRFLVREKVKLQALGPAPAL